MSLKACSLGLSLSALHRNLARLPCQPEAHAAAWVLWATQLELTGRDLIA